MSDTPRTDAEEVVYCEDEMCVPSSFSRQLERELAAAKKRIAELEANPPADRNLREQMSAMMSWMTHVTDMIVIHGLQADHAKIELSRRIDRAIVAATNCAMRKGEANAE